MLRNAIIMIATLVLISITSGPAKAQHTSFSGSWTLDSDASEFPQERRGGGARGRFGGGGPATITIMQTDSELVIERRIGGQNQTISHRLDGSSSENTGPRGGTTTTTTSWDDAALVTAGSQTVSTPRGELTLETQERRTLSRDGQTMTVASTLTTPRGDITITLVYRKADE
jgi:hypothetical protein